MKRLAFLVLFSLAWSANASIIGFDNPGSGWNYDHHYVEGDYDIDSDNDGFAHLPANTNVDYWLHNDTGTLLTWTNLSRSAGAFSGFTLTNNQGELFSLGSFDVGNGYVSGNHPIVSILLIGAFGSGGTIEQSFDGDFAGWRTLGLSAAWTGLESVVFRANGERNRAMWDNIEVSPSLVTTPIPGAAWLFASGLLALFGWRRKSEI